jgi:hypothetical protein
MILKILKYNWNVLLGIFFLLFVVEACNPGGRIPKEFPDKEEMAEILADLYVTESIIANARQEIENHDTNGEIPGYYKEVLDRYGLTLARFDTIRKWYADHPYHFQKVYDDALVIISKREADLDNKIREQEEKQDSVQTIKDLWDKSRKLSVNPCDTSDRRLPFKIDIDSVATGSLKLTAFYKFLRADMTRKSQVKMVTLFADSTADTISIDLKKSFKEKSLTLVQPIDTVDTVITVSGYLFDHDTSSVAAVEFSKIRLDHLLNEQVVPEFIKMVESK